VANFLGKPPYISNKFDVQFKDNCISEIDAMEMLLTLPQNGRAMVIARLSRHSQRIHRQTDATEEV
jgi:hypothetical protein